MATTERPQGAQRGLRPRFLERVPRGPVLTPWDRLLGWGAPSGSDARYRGSPSVPFPVLPVLARAVAWDMGVAVASSHPGWDLHELNLLRTPDGPVWVARETRSGTQEQFLVTGLSGDALPELGLSVRTGGLEVYDDSSEGRVRLGWRYRNADGEWVDIAFEGRPPDRPLGRRNASARGRGHDRLLVVRDVGWRGRQGRAEVRIGGTFYGSQRLGLFPSALTFVHAEAGLMVGQVEQRETDGGFSASGEWELERSGSFVEAVQRSALRTLRYRYLDTGEALELSSITCWQWGRQVPTLHLALSRALPDLRLRFPTRHVSRWLLDVNGRESHALGTIEAWWEAGEAVVCVRPERPRWIAGRPMRTRVRAEDGRVSVAAGWVGP